jgi:hypothetical protein
MPPKVAAITTQTAVPNLSGDVAGASSAKSWVAPLPVSSTPAPFKLFAGGAPTMKSPGPVGSSLPPMGPWGVSSPFLGPGLAAALSSIAAGVSSAPPQPTGTYNPGIPIPLPVAHVIVGTVPGNQGSSTIVSTITQGAAAGNPVAVANAKMLDLAQRLQIQASFAEQYLGPSVVAGILAGNPAALQVGTGKYDPNLPLVLEQTVDAMIATSKNAADLEQLAEALYQIAA